MHKIFIFSNLLLLFSISLNATELKIVPVGEAQADTLKYSISILKDNNASLKTIKNIHNVISIFFIKVSSGFIGN